MVRKRIEIAPLALYALAAGALTLSWVALELRVNVDAPRPQYAPRSLVAAAPTPAATCPPSYRPALQAIAFPPANYVETNAAPVLGTRLAPRCASQLLVLSPARPEWRAGDGQPWRLVGVDTLELMRRGGVGLGRFNDRLATRLDLRPLANRLAELRPTLEPKHIHSPAGLSAGPMVIGPGDRLAMASEAGRRIRPNLTIRQRDALDGLLDDLQTSADADPRPDSVLRAELVALLDPPETEPWAAEALRLLDLLTEDDALDADAYQAAAGAFAAHAEQGLSASEGFNSPRARVSLRKAAYAILRRARTWEITARLRERDALAAEVQLAADNALRQRLEHVATTLGAADNGDGWRRYLKVMQLQRALDDSQANNGAARRDLAKEILARLAAQSLTEQQRSFTSTGVLAALTDDLQLVAADPVDVPKLVNDLEVYEAKPSPALAERIALRSRALRHSAAQDHQRLADQIEQNYRNANLRVAVAADLLRRLLPKPQPEARSVAERIAGTPVRGAALTDTSLNLRLTPDPNAWRITLEARGEVTSRTVADGGPARLSTIGDTEFVARKPLLIHRHGVQTFAAECAADSHTQLVGIRTNFDGVPLVSDVIRSRAREEFTRNQGRARWETETRVGARVSTTLDQQADEFVAGLKRRYEQAVLARAEALRLEVEPIEVRTTDARLIARLRFANEQQLGSHTPRNRAPADSVISLQLHESLLNNALDGMDLARGPLTPDDLRAALRQRLLVDLPPAEPQEHRVEVTFDPEQPARVTLTNGRLELALAFADLQVDAARFGGFIVHARFEPRATLDGVWMDQVESVQIEGRMRSARRARLHAVFAQIMPPGRTIAVAASTPEQRDALAGLMVTQLIIDDGWLGVAVGPAAPERTAVRSRLVR